jgi:hypothetical protein
MLINGQSVLTSLNCSEIALKYIDLHIMSFQKSNIGDKVTGDKVTGGQNDQRTK